MTLISIDFVSNDFVKRFRPVLCFSLRVCCVIESVPSLLQICLPPPPSPLCSTSLILLKRGEGKEGKRTHMWRTGGGYGSEIQHSFSSLSLVLSLSNVALAITRFLLTFCLFLLSSHLVQLVGRSFSFGSSRLLEVGGYGSHRHLFTLKHVGAGVHSSLPISISLFFFPSPLLFGASAV